MRDTVIPPTVRPGKRKRFVCAGRAAVLACCLLLYASCGRLPPAEPAEGVGRKQTAASDADPVAADRASYGIPVSDGPAFEAVPTEGGEAEIDLTGLEKGALYVTVGTMNGSPEEYTGKTVRMAGIFETEETQAGRRFYCSVPDYAGCCFVSVEIRPSEDLRFPEDWPETGSVFTVAGVFGCDRINEYLSYSFLDGARIAWKR